MNLKSRLASLGRRFLKEESGQVFLVTYLGTMCLVGLAGVAVEVGHGYYALELLQASTNEATLAAAAGLPSSSQATTYAQSFSSLSNDQNQLQILQNVNLTVSPFCSTAVYNAYNVPCQSASGGTAYNAVAVVQTATSGLWLGRLFNGPSFTLEAVGTAAMAGGPLKPYNIALIIDTTGTMNNTDTSGDCGTGTVTSEECALQGVQTLLQAAYPCAAGQTCTDTDATPNDAVSLFVFPAIDGSTASNMTSCSASDPTTEVYTLPTHTAETYNTSNVPNGGVGYQVVTFPNGETYKSSDTSTSLRSGDILAQAAGANSCTGMKAKGGKGTYLAQVIYEAGEALQVEQAARPGTNNVMIILSDGNMDATMIYDSTTQTVNHVTTTTITSIDSTAEMQPTNGVVSGGTSNQLNGTKVAAWSAQQNTYTYPSAIGQCGQSVQAAYDVANKQTVSYTAGGTTTTYTLNNSNTTAYTKVYTVAYQSPNGSNGAGSQTGGNPESTSSTQECFSDLAYDVNNNWWNACGYSVAATACTVTITTGGGSWPAGESGFNGSGAATTIAATSPCASLAAMASSPSYFYSDQGDGCPVTSAANVINPNGTTGGLTTMASIFTKIVESLASPKLIPNGTT